MTTPLVAVATSSGVEPALALSRDPLPYSQPSASSPTSRSSSLKASSDINSLAEASNSPSPMPAPKLEITPSSAFKCPKCFATFAFQSKLTKHISTHTTFVCTFEGCIRDFRTPRDRERHIRSVHKTTNPDTCSICHRDFYRPDKYKEHIRTCAVAGMKRRTVGE